MWKQGQRTSLSFLLCFVLLLMACRETASNNPVHQQGRVVMVAGLAILDNPTSYLDLDTGSTGDSATGDIQLIISGGSTLFNVLVPVNGTRANSMGANEPSLNGCQDVLSKLTSGNIPEVFDGNYVCIVTNQGRLAQLQIEAVDHQGSSSSVHISFTTWEKVIDVTE